MTTRELEHLLNSRMYEQCIVTSQRGSWKWQDAYRIATYGVRLCADGKVRWVSMGRSHKYSEPQLRRRGVNLPYYSIHNQTIGRDHALQVLGKRLVAMVERRGWVFD